MKILIIDNYDSFSYNLFQYFGELMAGRGEVRVVRNDAITPTTIAMIERLLLPLGVSIQVPYWRCQLAFISSPTAAARRRSSRSAIASCPFWRRLSPT